MPRKPSKLLALQHLYDYSEFIYRVHDTHHKNKHDELISCALMGKYLWMWFPKLTTPMCSVVPDLNPQTSGSSEEDPYLCPLALLYYSYCMSVAQREKA